MWHKTAGKLILKNPHYTGDLVQGRSKVDQVDKMFHQEKGYKKRNNIDEENWLVNKNSITSTIITKIRCYWGLKSPPKYLTILSTRHMWSAVCRS
ncbi:recombinase family protein [Paenibacillus puerhi]|uniref:recombinase family protein n=1 Tax=Paenibacillus puerhi TaxID=2692622 RepID=UPI00135941DE